MGGWLNEWVGGWKDELWNRHHDLWAIGMNKASLEGSRNEADIR